MFSVYLKKGINKIRYLFNEYKIREKKASYGRSNPDKAFYIIGVNYKMAGLFAIVKSNLSHIAYAVENDYIPVIDMKNYYNQYIDKGDNSWEHFFEQPAGYGLEDINDSRNIVTSKQSQIPSSKYMINVNIVDKSNIRRLEYFRGLYRKYIRFNKKTKSYIFDDYDRVIGHERNVLGVLCRGTDYLYKKPMGHPVQPQPEEVIKKAKQVFLQKKYNKIYLSTEDRDIFEMFKSEFGNLLLTNSQNLYSYNDIKNVQYLSEIDVDNMKNRNLKGLSYLSSLYILSKCSYFIGGRTSGTVGVYLMTDGFEFDYTWNLGNYK